MLFYVSISIGALAVAAFNFVKTKKAGYIGLAAKMSASIPYLLAGIFGGLSSGAPASYFALIVTGLIFGVTGDFFLEYVTVRPKYKAAIFVAGLVAYMVGHMLYIVAAFSFAEPTILSLFIPITCAFVLAVTVIFYVAPACNLEFRRLSSVCFVYCFVLLLFVLSAVSVGVEHGFTVPRILVLIGSLVFVLSHAAMTRLFFNKTENADLGYTPAPRSYYYFNNATLHLAQYLVALSLFFI